MIACEVTKLATTLAVAMFSLAASQWGQHREGRSSFELRLSEHETLVSYLLIRTQPPTAQNLQYFDYYIDVVSLLPT